MTSPSQNVNSREDEFSTIGLPSTNIDLSFAANRPQSRLLEFRGEALIDIPNHFVFHKFTQLQKQLYLVMIYGDSFQVALLKKVFKKTYDIELIIHALVLAPIIIIFVVMPFNPFEIWSFIIGLILGPLVVTSFIKTSKAWGHRTKSTKSREDYINLNQSDYLKYKEEEGINYSSSSPTEIVYCPNLPPEYEGNSVLPSYTS